MKHHLYVALEADFILALALGSESALACFDYIHSKFGGFAIVPPSVLQELEYLATSAVSAADRVLAASALSQLTNLCVLCPPIGGADNGVVGIIADRIAGKSLCSGFQAASILVEASHLKCRMLFTYDDDLCDRSQEINIALIENGLSECMIIHPDLLVKVFEDRPVRIEEIDTP